MQVRDVWVKPLARHRGAPRIFLDGLQCVRTGFAPGDAYEVEVDGTRVVLEKRRDGSRRVSSRKPRREGDAATPVLDINSAELLSIFDGMDAVRVVVANNAVYLLPLATEVKRRERMQRLQGKISAGQPLKVGAIAHGGGLLTQAIHDGLQRAGLECELAFANEIREDLLTHALEHHKAWGASTSALALPMQELIQDDWLMGKLPKLEVLELGGLPCSGASKAGKAKNQNARMEDHASVGHLVHAALTIVNKTQPAVLMLENVIDYSHSASAQILRQQLRDMGYDTHEAVLRGKEWGCLEDRNRWCLVAVTRGMPFSFQDIRPVQLVRSLASVLDEFAPDDPIWKRHEHLVDKRAQDAAKGNNFKMQFIDPAADRVPVLRRGYHKAGSSDPRLPHPSDPDRSRLLTADEHARVKGFDPAIVQGLPQSVAHQMLGQGIVYMPFFEQAQALGRSIVAFCTRQQSAAHDEQVPAERMRAVG